MWERAPNQEVSWAMPLRSVANAQRLTLIDKTKLVRRVGQVDPVTMSELTNAVCALLDC